MSNRWGFATHVGAALIAAVVSAYATYKTTENNVELENLKIESERLQEERDSFRERCEELKALHQDISLGLQAIYLDDAGEDSLAMKLARLRSQAVYAQSFFGEKARDIKKRAEIEVKEKKEGNPVHDLAPYVMGLGEELKSCNQ
ncbi:hypothetical protein ACUN8C_14750 [Kushneria sp. Sum13]|uniref:hypothetical protein n=1 Tax=Kushneria sp. Sum13 TaxID=3459196 RepID=UPI0040458BEB